MSGFTHFDDAGKPRMVDVSGKAATERVATAKGRVRLQPATLALIEQGQVAKGDVLSVARLAGIMGAKRTPELMAILLEYGAQAKAVIPELQKIADGFEKGTPDFPKALSLQKANSVRQTIRAIEAATESPELITISEQP